MAELAQILLPPPTPPQRATLPVRDGTDLAVNADASTGGESARARRFRFRVYEGGDAGETNTRTDTARPETGRAEINRAGSGRLSLVSDSSTSSQAQADRARNRRGSDAGNAPFSSTASSAFLAQSIAQEQLGDGLYNPPNQQATVAYTRAATALTPRASAGINLSA